MIELYAGAHYLINPGSVGQPRDGDPRAAFGVLDVGPGAASERDRHVVRFHRVAFDTSAAMAKAARAGLLPEARPFAQAVRRGLAALWRLP